MGKSTGPPVTTPGRSAEVYTTFADVAGIVPGPRRQPVGRPGIVVW